MSHLRQTIFCLAAVMVVFGAHVQNSRAAEKNVSPVTNLVPPMPPPAQSPVNFFRQLLAMSTLERNAALTNRSSAIRARILAKVREYQALGPDERELRLRATELRWYLMPLLRSPATERQARLAAVPPDLRALVENRLTQWDLLPPPLQQEFLANDQALHYFAHMETVSSPANPQQEKIAAQFDQFFELTPSEKRQTLSTLSGAERAQMEKTLQSFEQLPPQQRRLCVRNYAKFAGMSGRERAEFLKNAENWSKMSPQERQTWRDLVAHVPLWPPAPPAVMPPLPHAAPKFPRANMVTN